MALIIYKSPFWLTLSLLALPCLAQTHGRRAPATAKTPAKTRPAPGWQDAMLGVIESPHFESMPLRGLEAAFGDEIARPRLGEPIERRLAAAGITAELLADPDRLTPEQRQAFIEIARQAELIYLNELEALIDNTASSPPENLGPALKSLLRLQDWDRRIALELSDDQSSRIDAAIAVAYQRARRYSGTRDMEIPPAAKVSALLLGASKAPLPPELAVPDPGAEAPVLAAISDSRTRGEIASLLTLRSNLARWPTWQEVENALVSLALRATASPPKSERLLGVGRKFIHLRMERYGLAKPKYRDRQPHLAAMIPS
ncbi:MAG: hypothetical protein HY549_12485 [Elusimicrobia bacterium]|nr:hypothetical protein [Elusimicrobiota bacterium]